MLRFRTQVLKDLEIIEKFASTGKVYFLNDNKAAILTGIVAIPCMLFRLIGCFYWFVSFIGLLLASVSFVFGLIEPTMMIPEIGTLFLQSILTMLFIANILRLDIYVFEKFIVDMEAEIVKDPAKFGYTELKLDSDGRIVWPEKENTPKEPPKN